MAEASASSATAPGGTCWRFRATLVRKLPEGISFEEGAALSHVGVVAYGALRHGELKAGETLLVLGATGGVGSAAIQLGKALGASVIAVVSKPESASEVRDLGADHVTVLSDGPLAEAVQKLTDGKGANVVLDPLGGEFTGVFRSEQVWSSGSSWRRGGRDADPSLAGPRQERIGNPRFQRIPAES